MIQMKNVRLINLLTVAFMALLAGCSNTPAKHKSKRSASFYADWDRPIRQDMWRTTYSKTERKADEETKHDMTSACIPLTFATDSPLGFVAAPSSFPLGSIVVIPENNSCFFVADRGTDVDSGKAAKISGRNDVEKRAPVFDFFLKHPLWSTKENVGQYAVGMLYPYHGNTPFCKLKLPERLKVYEIAKTKVVTLSHTRLVASYSQSQ
jgi:3D (Asp-Asp-Asp) domain-containing protein